MAVTQASCSRCENKIALGEWDVFLGNGHGFVDEKWEIMAKP